MARFFYALRPDARAAAELGRLAQRVAEALGGRPLSARDLHLTLVFVGERPADEAPSLRALLAGLDPHWPTLPLSRLGSFGRGLWWAGCTGAIPEWPAQLAGQLQQRLRQAGIGFDQRALHLHVTLVRGAHRRHRRPRVTREGATAAADPSGPPGESAASGAIATLAEALPIASSRWTLALGSSGVESTPLQRYQWHDAPG